MTKTLEQVTRAYGTLDFIEAHPDKHDQGSWVDRPDRRWLEGPANLDNALAECGTTACYAGWALLLAGRKIGEWTTPDALGSAMVPLEAARLLGLDSEEIYPLFFYAADLAEVRKAVFEIFGPRPDGAM